MENRNASILVAYVSLAVAAFLVGRNWPASDVDPKVASEPGSETSGPPQPSPPAAGQSRPVVAPAAPAQAPAAGQGEAKAPVDQNQVWRVTLDTDDATKGPASAPVTIVVFSTFLCPECATMAGILDRILADFPGKVRIVFKHKIFPNHLHTMEAAQAGAEAQAQGKFWQFHDLAHKKGAMLDRHGLEAVAREAGLDMERFKAALDGERHRGKVLRDSLLAVEVAANSMPNVMVNGVRLFGEKTYENLKPLVERQIAEAQKRIAAGTPAAQIHEKAVANGKRFEPLDPRRFDFKTADDAAIGPLDAKIQVVAFEDFQCPFCAKAAPSLAAFQKRFPQDVRLVFKHFPLTSLHPNAQGAAEAAAEARRQGKFWPFHDLLFANQQRLDRAGLEALAQQAGLDVAALRRSLDAHDRAQEVQQDVSEGEAAGVSGTPTVFLNGHRYQGPSGNPAEGYEAVARMYLGLGK